MKLKGSPGMLLVVGGGFAMVLDTLLAWQSVTVDSQTYSRNAWHGFWGIILGLLSIAFLANAVVWAGIVETKVRLPHKLLGMVLGPAILAFAVIKNIDDPRSGWASYVGVVIGALITWGAWMLWNEKPAEEAPADASSEGAPSPSSATDESPKAD